MLLTIRYCDQNDNESIRQIDEAPYRKLLQTKTGDDLAHTMLEQSELTDRDPRMSDLEECDVFFSDKDVRTGITTAQELLTELNETV